jgi:D-alanyl-D-alanine carboxypeptidase/D-alanyl-D-alanine-endopeptidase (penicillin-binding protein 4)
MNKFAWMGLLAYTAFCTLVAAAQGSAPQTFSEAVQQVISRPLYRHAVFGIEVYSLDTQKPLFALNGDKLFTPGSTTKLLTEGTALHLLGPDYRFHTFIYRTGEIDGNGKLKGDLVLVASGDPNLSNRMQPDGTLAFADEDHSYGGPDSRLIPGDPLIVMQEFAKQIVAAGIKRVEGSVVVDVSLFPEGDRELGTGVVISPIAVNDNVIDVTIEPGTAAGAPAKLSYSLQVPYIHFDNRIITAAGSKTSLDDPQMTQNADGTQTVVLSGSIAQTSKPRIYGYPVASPSRFAAEALTAALTAQGVKITGKPAATVDAIQYKSFYNSQHQVAEHVSAPLAEEVKVTLKVSQNLHASMTPYILGAIVGKATTKIDQKGFALEHDFLTAAGLDLSGASQADGAGGATSAYYTPDFMVHYLAYMAGQPIYAIFQKALPILGRDGTLADIQRESPAAGHVFAKTGTLDSFDLLNMQIMLVGKGLAGYTTTANGEHLAFAIYMNHVALPDDPDTLQTIAGEALGVIASAVYSLPIDKSLLDAR